MEKLIAPLDSLPENWREFVEEINDLTAERFKEHPDGIYDCFCELSEKQVFIIKKGGDIFRTEAPEIIGKIGSTLS